MPSKRQAAQQIFYSLHDAFFKKIFSNPKYLLELLLIIFPKRFVEALDASSLTIKDSLVLKLEGGEMRTDLTVSVRLKGTDIEVIITFVLEHKSYSDPDAGLQTMEYYIRSRRQQRKQRVKKKGAPRHLIIPVIIMCCKDENFELPVDDLSLEFGDEEIPPILEEFRSLFPKMPCWHVNLRKLPLDKFWEDAKCAVTAARGMAEVWQANDDTLAELISKGRMLAPDDRSFILEALNVYYVCADNMVKEGDFMRVDRERWPDLAEGERMENILELPSERAERRGIEKGIEQGRTEGIEQGRTEGIEQGRTEGIEQGKMDMVKRLLLDGVDEQTIRRAAQLSKRELAQVKRSLDRN